MERIFELMELALSAYSDEQIRAYFDQVRQDRLREHGFPRLTANIGILIAHGRRQDLLPIFLEMMEFCCRSIPNGKAANDFSVREIVCCIREVERSGVADVASIARWKGYLATIDPMICYSQKATAPTDKLKNWALFTGVSEYFRMEMGVGGSEAFIDIQIASQLQWLDENDMYMDGEGDIHHPVMYDLVPRALFAMLLSAGYRGRYYGHLDACLKRTGLMMLKMQSPNGEMWFGGRSNQFVHNETNLILLLEYEARRYAAAGDLALAGQFKAAAQRALSVVEQWLSLKPIYHTKNRFPTESQYGCEKYAYFNKYMITVASFLYAAYLVCDDTIPVGQLQDTAPACFETTYHFHKFFMKAGGYGLEFDLNGDPHYDASGLGRVHRVGAPGAICMSLPCPKAPVFTVDIPPAALSLCPGILVDGAWKFATEEDTQNTVVDSCEGENYATATVRSRFANGTEVLASYRVDADGVKIHIAGQEDVAYLLPAFAFDGETHSQIVATENALRISYGGWVCRYSVSGDLKDLQLLAPNRNGHYAAYFAAANKNLDITIEIMKG